MFKLTGILALTLIAAQAAVADIESSPQMVGSEQVSDQASTTNATNAGLGSVVTNTSPLGEIYSPPKIDPKRSEPQAYGTPVNRMEWAVINMMVDKQGKPYEATIEESSGNSAYEKWALGALKKFRFHPATVGGEAVDAAFTFKVTQQSRPDGASSQFKKLYETLYTQIESGDQAAADKTLQSMKVKNSFEDAYYHLGRVRYLSRWGSEQEQFEELIKLVTYRQYIPVAVSRNAARQIFNFHLKNSNLAAALSVHDNLFDAETRKDPDIVRQISEVKTIIGNQGALSVRGEIKTRHSWVRRLVKKNFSILLSKGAIAEIKLRCDAKYLLVKFRPDFEYSIPKEFGACTMEIVGDNGTEFTLIES